MTTTVTLTHPDAHSTPTSPDVAAISVDGNTDQVRSSLKQSLEGDIKIARQSLPPFVKDAINPDALELKKTPVSGVYEIVLPPMVQGIEIDGKIFVNNTGALVNEQGQVGNPTKLTLNLPSNINGLYVPIFGMSGGIKELTKGGQMTEQQARELITFIKSANLRGGKNAFTLTKSNTGLSFDTQA